MRVSFLKELTMSNCPPVSPQTQQTDFSVYENAPAADPEELRCFCPSTNFVLTTLVVSVITASGLIIASLAGLPMLPALVVIGGLDIMTVVFAAMCSRVHP